MRRLFEEALPRIQQGLMSIILLDDIDLVNNLEPERIVCLSNGEKLRTDASMAAKIKAEILLGMRQIQRVHDGLFVVATTNRPWHLCSALRRRFDKRIFCPLPDPHARGLLVDNCFRESQVDQSDSLLAAVRPFVVDAPEGHSAGSICAWVFEALSAQSKHQQGRRDFRDEQGYSRNFLQMPCDRLTIPESTEADFHKVFNDLVPPAGETRKKVMERYEKSFPH
jgi:vacuolar protein-sorting-associated protein 4